MKTALHNKQTKRNPAIRRLLILGLACLLIIPAGCASVNGEDTPPEETPVEELYNQAASALDRGDYIEATGLFEEVERQYPYSQWATRAELMAAFGYYKAQRYDEAVLSLNRFTELHPGNKDIDYALYLKALSFYEQITDVGRDQAMTREALDALTTLTRRFPESRYARDARYKKDLTLDHLAGKEMEVGRYYLNRNHINAAINRFKVVVEDYQTTTHVAEALHRLVEAYTTLGVIDQATRIAAVLGHNYPGSKWYEETYKILDPEQRRRIVEDRDWMDKTVDSLFKPT